jgi:hypothetical protein
MRVSGCRNHYKILLASRARYADKRSKEKKAFGPINHLQFLLGWRLRHQAKSVTNNLPILSVLGKVILRIYLEAANLLKVRISQEGFYELEIFPEDFFYILGTGIFES